MQSVFESGLLPLDSCSRETVRPAIPDAARRARWECVKARTAKGREMPNGAKCQTAQRRGAKFRTAQNSERREIPKGAESQTARNPKRRRWKDRSSPRSGVWHVRKAGVCLRSARAPFGILRGLERRMAFGAVRNLASFGTWRRLAPRAVRNSAPLRCAVWHFALFRTSRRFEKCGAETPNCRVGVQTN
jgi:hypothetical protein